jgi:hypothetical protein
LSRPPEAAAVRPASIAAAAALLAALAGAMLPRLVLAPCPRLGGPRLEVEAVAAGAERDELLARFTGPLERRLLALPDVVGVDSWTADGTTKIVVRGEVAADAERLRGALEQRLAELDLRPDEARVELAPADRRALFEVAVVGADAAARTAFARGVVLPELARAGAGERVDLIGATPLRVVVEPRQAALAARGITAGDVADRLRQLGTTAVVGRVREGAVPRPLVVGEEVTSLAALRELRVPGPTGEAVLRDVALVSLQPLGDGGAYRLDGAPAVLVRVFAARRGNAMMAGVRLRRSLAALRARAPAGVTLRVVGDAGAASASGVAGAALCSVAAGLGAGAWLGRRRGSWKLALAVASVPPLALLLAVLPLALAGVVLDPWALAVVEACAGALAWPACALASGPPAATMGRGRWRDARPAMAGFALMVVAWAPLALLGGRAAPAAATGAAAVLAAAAMAVAIAAAFAAALAASLGGDEATSPPRRQPVAAVLAVAAVLIVAVGAWLVREWPERTGLATRATAELLVTYELSPDLSPPERLRRGERLAAELLQALPSQPLWSSWEQAEPPRVDIGEPDGALRLMFDGGSQARRGAAAVSKRLFAAPDVRGDVALAAMAANAGAEPAALAAPSLWLSAPSAARRAELVARLATTLRAALPAAALVPMRTAGSEWRLAARAPGVAERLVADVGSALGASDAGNVRIPGAEPEIRLVAAPEAEQLALLAVHGSRQPSAVVPLAAAASLQRAARQPPLQRHDGSAGERWAVRGADERQLARLDTRLRAAARGNGERVQLDGTAGATGLAARKLRSALAMGALAVVVALLAVGGPPRIALLFVLPLVLAWIATFIIAVLARGGQLEPFSLALALLMVSGLSVQPAMLVAWQCGAGAPALGPAKSTLAAGLCAVLGSLIVAWMVGDPFGRELAAAVAGGLVAALATARMLLPRLVDASSPTRVAHGGDVAEPA